MRKTGETARAEARIKQLCCLGLGSEAIAPALFRELRAVIAAAGVNCFWVGPRGEMVNFYDDHPDALPKVAPLYMAEFYGKERERRVTRSMAEAAREEHGVVGNEQANRVSPREFERSDFYNLVLRPLGYGTVLRLVLRELDRPTAILQLHRSLQETGFSPMDRERLARIESFLVHALVAKVGNDEQPAPFIDSGEQGMIIAGRDGRPLSFSPDGLRLLMLATNARFGSSRPIRLLQLPPAVAALCKHLEDVYAGRADAPAPVVRHCNVWGRFTFRAYWLNARSPGAGHIGITVTRDEPLSLRLWRGARDLPLTRRQSEIAILLAAGHTHAAIGRQLNITRNTAISHSRWIYAKLGVHDAAALREKLLDNCPETLH